MLPVNVESRSCDKERKQWLPLLRRRTQQCRQTAINNRKPDPPDPGCGPNYEQRQINNPGAPRRQQAKSAKQSNKEVAVKLDSYCPQGAMDELHGLTVENAGNGDRLQRQRLHDNDWPVLIRKKCEYVSGRQRRHHDAPDKTRNQESRDNPRQSFHQKSLQIAGQKPGARDQKAADGEEHENREPAGVGLTTRQKIERLRIELAVNEKE